MQATASTTLAVEKEARPGANPAMEVRDERIKAHLGLARSIARRIASGPVARGVALDDLVAYGSIGLVEAATRFDGRDVPFAVFARRRIEGAILDGIRAQHWFGRRADRGLRVERIGVDWDIELSETRQPRTDARWNGRTMAGIPIEAEDAVYVLVASELAGLPTRERHLVELCYYQGKSLSQAAKEMAIGRPWASRLHARALAALRAAVQTSSFLSLPPSPRNNRSVLERPNAVSSRPAIGTTG
jgi:RNA polymerase sigma factor for flagellar operon FliA